MTDGRYPGDQPFRSPLPEWQPLLVTRSDQKTIEVTRPANRKKERKLHNIRKSALLRTGVGIAVAAMALAACGSSTPSAKAIKPVSSSGSSGVATAKAQVAKFETEPTYNDYGSAFNISSAKGDKVLEIPLSSTDPDEAYTDTAMQEAATTAGLKFQVYNNSGEVSQWIAGIQLGISEHVAAIILQSISPEQVLPAVQAAHKAGIPIIAVHQVDPKLYPAGSFNPAAFADVAASVPGPFVQASDLDADYAIAQSNGKAHVMFINAPGDINSGGESTRFDETMAKYCPNCKVTTVGVPIPDWATSIQGDVQSFLLAHPATNWIIPIFDSETEYVIPGVAAEGKTSSVKIASFNGTPPILKYIAQGTMAMDVAESFTWLGYADIDATLRVLTHQPNLPITDYEAEPLRIITKANIGSEFNSSGTFTDDAFPNSSYVSGFTSRWKTS